MKFLLYNLIKAGCGLERGSEGGSNSNRREPGGKLGAMRGRRREETDSIINIYIPVWIYVFLCFRAVLLLLLSFLTFFPPSS